MTKERDKQIANWRIDSKVSEHSYWELLISLLWMSVVFMMMFLADLSWWQWLVMFIVLCVSLYFYKLQACHVVHITQPAVTSVNQDSTKQRWFVYVNSGSNTKLPQAKQLWQCYLASVYSNKYLVVLYFEVVSPEIKPLTLLIWRDQLNHDDWRKLQVFAQYL